MNKNSSGRTLTIFLIVIVILLSALSGIFFYEKYQKESELKKSTADMEDLKNNESKVQAELKEAKKRIFLLEEKNKEADEKINDLMDNLELEQGLREEMKTENSSLREALEGENKSKEQMREDIMKDLTAAQDRVKEVETLLAAEQDRAKTLESQSQTLQEQMKQMQVDFNSKLEKDAAVPSTTASQDQPAETQIELPADLPPNALKTKDEDDSEIDLDKIVVAPKTLPEGRVLSVDKENEFLIFNLGQKNGIIQGLVLSVYRGPDYLGDIRVTRVQPEMSAADFIPPFSSQRVRKNDQVVTKNDSQS